MPGRPSAPARSPAALDEELSRPVEEQARVADALVELERHPGNRLLGSATLTGVTATRWAAVQDVLPTLWADFPGARRDADTRRARRPDRRGVPRGRGRPRGRRDRAPRHAGRAGPADRKPARRPRPGRRSAGSRRPGPRGTRRAAGRSRRPAGDLHERPAVAPGPAAARPRRRPRQRTRRDRGAAGPTAVRDGWRTDATSWPAGSPPTARRRCASGSPTIRTSSRLPRRSARCSRRHGRTLRHSLPHWSPTSSA